jgi:hypothetical protein
MDIDEGFVADEGGNVGAPEAPKNMSETDPGLNADQNALRTEILGAVESNKQQLFFVQGEPGCGKTYAVTRIHSAVSVLCGNNGLRCLAPTGVACNFLPGTLTIHSGLQINPKDKKQFASGGHTKPRFLARYDTTRVFVVDEISMATPALFAQMNQRLKELASGVQQQKPFANEKFGGYTVVVMGDFDQIPPVGSKSLLADAMESNPSPGGMLFRSFRSFRWKQQMRAQDPAQMARVEQLKKGVVTKELLNGIKRMTSEDACGDFMRATFLTATNSDRYAINDVLAVVFGLLHGVPVIKWRHALTGSMAPVSDSPLFADLLYSAPELSTTFVAGAPGMCFLNFCPACGLANGSPCTLHSLVGVSAADTRKISVAQPGEVIWLERPPEYVLVHLPVLDALEHLPFILVDGKRMVPLDSKPDDLTLHKKTITFHWHHVGLAFASTIHKCQGQTLDKAVLVLDKAPDQKSPLSFEQLNVAITRVRRADDLRVLPPHPTSDQEFSHLLKLKPLGTVEKWFKGPFDKDGRRKFRAV